MLQLTDVHTYYGNRQVLRGVTLDVKPGTVVALLGRNGMGKTTTIRTIVGFTPPRSGSIRFLGKEIAGASPEMISRAGIGLVPQGRMIFSSLTVEENLIIGARGGGKSNAWNLDKAYEQFPSLKRRARCKGGQLSGGEQQMLAIARALMTNPKLILLDEPSEGLAPIIVDEIEKIILQLKDEGYAILLVEQNISQALEIADHTFIMNKGAIAHECTADALRGDEAVKNRYLGVEH